MSIEKLLSTPMIKNMVTKSVRKAMKEDGVTLITIGLCNDELQIQSFTDLVRVVKQTDLDDLIKLSTNVQ